MQGSGLRVRELFFEGLGLSVPNHTKCRKVQILGVPSGKFRS